MTLQSLINTCVEEITRFKLEDRSDVEMKKRVRNIIETSSIKVDHKGIWLKSYSQIGIGEEFLERGVKVPNFMCFKVSEDWEEWVLTTLDSHRQLESYLRTADTHEIAVALIAGEVYQYRFSGESGIFSDKIVWEKPIYRVDYLLNDGRKMSESVFDGCALHELVLEKVKLGYSSVKVYSSLTQENEPFFVTGIVYSSNGGSLPLQLVWGKIDFSEFHSVEEELW